jgi:hypothetical protein
MLVLSTRSPSKVSDAANPIGAKNATTKASKNDTLNRLKDITSILIGSHYVPNLVRRQIKKAKPLRQRV